ncbi:MAG: hypothetical protein IPG45_31585 [Deltaproteobacteria bacterium]|nr:hypothetical protein [Deltaproteobacteria bacterium]
MAKSPPIAPGHDPGHGLHPPVGWSWESYVLAFVEEYGGWVALTDELLRRARGAELPTDPQVVEKGLRRLAQRGQKTGGQYGGWMIRFLGLPTSLLRWAQWMGQFHSRFADLPTSLRLAQLGLWDRPPVSESKAAAWVHVGLASALLRRAQQAEAERRLALAEAGAKGAGVACQVEVALLQAKLQTDRGERAEAERNFERVAGWLGDGELSTEDRRCYEARLVGQRAYHLTKPLPGDEEDLQGALRLFVSLVDEPFLPFVAFRKCNGLAYCHWKLGDVATGIRYARLAEQHAGDGGQVRFRIMALNLLARMVPPEEAPPIQTRAQGLAQMIEDEDLLRRLKKGW